MQVCPKLISVCTKRSQSSYLRSCQMDACWKCGCELMLILVFDCGIMQKGFKIV